MATPRSGNTRCASPFPDPIITSLTSRIGGISPPIESSTPSTAVPWRAVKTTKQHHTNASAPASSGNATGSKVPPLPSPPLLPIPTNHHRHRDWHSNLPSLRHPQSANHHPRFFLPRPLGARRSRARRQTQQRRLRALEELGGYREADGSVDVE